MKQDTRVFRVREQLSNIVLGSKSFIVLKYHRKSGLMNKKLKERIMLAITEVNGCSMCSYVHTQIALSSGMSKEDIAKILNGDTTTIPDSDAVAVMFAQEFAYTKENPSTESYNRLVSEYGKKKANLIVAACHMITMTNGMGTSMDYLYNRLRFKRYKKSNILVELLNPLLTMLLFPPLTIFNFFRCRYLKLIRRKEVTLRYNH